MEPLLVATSQADAAAAEQIRQHHAELTGALQAQVETLTALVTRNDWEAAEVARRRVVTWTSQHVLPHATAEEGALYPAARALPAGTLLVDALITEHRLIASLLAAVDEARQPVVAAAKAEALATTFISHVAKENEQILPLLAQSPEVSIAALLEGMHDHLGAQDSSAVENPGADGATCSCGEDDHGTLPELDARLVPHAIRHATIFGALDGTGVGGGIVLVAPHDPLPMLKQLSRRSPGEFEVRYLERGPEAWRLRISRTKPADPPVQRPGG